MVTTRDDIRYCTNCRKTTHSDRVRLENGREAFQCKECGAILYPYAFFPTDASGKRRR